MRKICLFPIVFCVVALFTVSAFAQERNPNGSAPQWYVLLEEGVHPGMSAEYEAGTRSWITSIDAARLPLYFFAMSDDSITYTYVVPIRNFAEIDQVSRQWSQAANLLKKDSAAGAARQKAVQWTRYTIWLNMPELEFIPSNPEVDPMTARYSESTELRVRPENEAAFYEIAAKVKALHEKHSMRRQYNVYRGIVGVKGPTYVFVWGGSDAGDLWHYFRSQKPQFMQELMQLLGQLYDLTEERTPGKSYSRPDLSHTPPSQ